MWHHEGMTPEEHRENLRRIAAVRDSEAAAALAALRAGVRQVDIAEDLRRTREHVRRITRAAEQAEAAAARRGDVDQNQQSAGESPHAGPG